MCLCVHGAGLDVFGAVVEVHVEMEDNAIPEEYFTCHADKLFDLLASSLVDFAKRHGRYGGACLWLPEALQVSLVACKVVS